MLVFVPAVHVYTAAQSALAEMCVCHHQDGTRYSTSLCSCQILTAVYSGNAGNASDSPESILCSADDPMAQPPHGTEVFVGGVPRTATEEQLSVFAAEVGEVHGITLLREPQNPEHNRG